MNVEPLNLSKNKQQFAVLVPFLSSCIYKNYLAFVIFDFFFSFFFFLKHKLVIKR